jgi:hypothetical protein
MRAQKFTKENRETLKGTGRGLLKVCKYEAQY